MAAELLKDCPADSFDDCVRIAAAIARGDEVKEILRMPEMERWPDARQLIEGQV